MIDETVETLTVSKLLRYAPAGEYMCATGARGARTLRCGEMIIRSY